MHNLEKKSENIFLFVPNLIGYGRIFLAIVSFYYMPSHPKVSIFCYLLSGFLDAFDGHAARYLNQGTKFGSMLDMLTDRCATMCLCVVLAMFYPNWAIFFQLSMSLDIASHWLHMHSLMMKGSSHKSIDLSGNPILRVYYTSRPVLFLMCAGNELFFSMLYLLHFYEDPTGILKCIFYISTPIALLKSAINIVHLVTAARNMAALDLIEREEARQLKAN